MSDFCGVFIVLRTVLRNPQSSPLAPLGADFSIDYVIDGMYPALGRARRLGSALKNKRKEASRPPKMTIESALSGSLITSLRLRVSLPSISLSLSLSLSLFLFFSRVLKFDSFGRRARRALSLPSLSSPFPKEDPEYLCHGEAGTGLD